MENRVDELLTIIVPAYNVEKYIAECLDSLVNQTREIIKLLLLMMVPQMEQKQYV